MPSTWTGRPSSPALAQLSLPCVGLELPVPSEEAAVAADHEQAVE
jgi:hypothetical protein